MGKKRKGVYIWCMLGSKLMCVPINPITFQDEQQEFLNNYIPEKNLNRTTHEMMLYIYLYNAKHPRRSPSLKKRISLSQSFKL